MRAVSARRKTPMPASSRPGVPSTSQSRSRPVRQEAARSPRARSTISLIIIGTFAQVARASSQNVRAMAPYAIKCTKSCSATRQKLAENGQAAFERLGQKSGRSDPDPQRTKAPALAGAVQTFVVKSRFPLPGRGHPQYQRQDNGLCSRSWCDPAESELPGDCRSVCR